MLLNHLDLSVTDVSVAARFLTTHFGFTVLEDRPATGMAILRDSGDFVLALSQLDADRRDPGGPDAYPTEVHIGFLLEDGAAVERKREEMAAAGVADLSPMQASMRATVFYCRLPGGIP